MDIYKVKSLSLFPFNLLKKPRNATIGRYAYHMQCLTESVQQTRAGKVSIKKSLLTLTLAPCKNFNAFG